MGSHVVIVRVVTASSKHTIQAVSSHHEKVCHRRESCPLENLYVRHFVLPFDLHDLPQMS